MRTLGVLNRLLFKFSKIYYPYKIKKIAAKCNDVLYVGGKSYVTSNTDLGKHVCFNGMAISGKGKVEIDDYFHSGPGCQIITSFYNYEDSAIPYDDSFVDKNVKINKCVWLGNNVIILGGKHRRRSYYTSRLRGLQGYSCFSIAGRHPADPFKYRNKQHYKKLENEGKFH